MLKLDATGQYSDPLVLKFLFVFVWVIAWVVASADFFACGIRFAFLLWSLPCFKWNVLILKSHALCESKGSSLEKNAHTLSLTWEIRHVFVCLWKSVLNQKNKQATRYSTSMWFVLNTQWKLDVSSDKEVHKLILVWNHKRATLWSLLILKLLLLTF